MALRTLLLLASLTAFSVAQAPDEDATVTIETSHGGAGSGLTNTTITVPLGAIYSDPALSEVSYLFLTGAVGVPLESITCTPYRYANGTGNAGLPFTSTKPSLLSTNDVQVGSLVCVTSYTGSPNTTSVSNLSTTSTSLSTSSSASASGTAVAESTPSSASASSTAAPTSSGAPIQSGSSLRTATSAASNTGSGAAQSISTGAGGAVPTSTLITTTVVGGTSGSPRETSTVTLLVANTNLPGQTASTTVNAQAASASASSTSSGQPQVVAGTAASIDLPWVAGGWLTLALMALGIAVVV